jgi:hypothetical protein
MERFAPGGFHVTYEKRVDLDALRKKRIARAEEQRRNAGLDALLVWKDENCRYLTDLRPQLIAGKTTALNGALLIEGRAPILFCSGGERDRVDRTMPWIEEAHTIPIIEEKALVEGMVDRILGPVLRKHGLSDAKVGLDEANTVFVKALAQRFPKLIVEDGDTPMQQARMIKVPEEIALLEEATALADAVTASGVAAIAEGVRECEVAAEAMRTLFRLGGEYAHVMTPFVASGENMAPPHRICSDKMATSSSSTSAPTGTAISAMWHGPRSAARLRKSRRRSSRQSTTRSKPASPKCGPDEPTRTLPTLSSALRANMDSAIGSCPYSSRTVSASARTNRPISARRCPGRRSMNSSPAWFSPSSR